jgi:chemotaxis protein MotB
MKTKIVAFAIAAFALSSCVSSSKYDAMVAERDQVTASKDSLQNEYRLLNAKYLEKVDEVAGLKQELKVMTDKYNELKKSYEALKTSSTENVQDLLTRIETLEKSIAEKEAKIADINQKLAERENKMKRLQQTISNALLSFKDSGLEVSIKDGKVYVSLSNKLLFSSGSTKIDKEGQKALIELANVLKTQPDINVLVEGHTDDKKVSGGQRFSDNWDLSFVLLKLCAILLWTVVSNQQESSLPAEENFSLLELKTLTKQEQSTEEPKSS